MNDESLEGAKEVPDEIAESAKAVQETAKAVRTGIEATQRGRRSLLQEPFTRSITRSAVVLLSMVTGFSSGAGSGFTFGHSSMMVAAPAAPTANPPASAIAANIIKCEKAGFMIVLPGKSVLRRMKALN